MSGSESGMVKPTPAMGQGAPSRLYFWTEIRIFGDQLSKLNLRYIQSFQQVVQASGDYSDSWHVRIAAPKLVILLGNLLNRC